MARFRAVLFVAVAIGACGDPTTDEALAPDAAVLVDPEPEPEPEPEGEPVAVTLTLVDPPDVAGRIGTYVAFQNGSGAWSKLETSNNVYSATTTTGRFGFLIVCGDPSDRGYRRIIYQTTDDGTAVIQRSCSSVWAIEVPYSITGTVAHAGGESIKVDTSTLPAWVMHGAPTTYATGSMPGTTDLLVAGTTDAKTFRYLRRDLGTVASDRTVNVDMGDALPGELSAISMEGLTAADTYVYTGSAISGGVGLESPVGSYSLPSHEGSAPLAHRLPVALRKPEDIVMLYASVEQASAGASSMYVIRESYDKAAANHALPALPDVLAFAPPTLGADASTPWTFALPRVPLGPDSRLYLTTTWMALTASAAWVNRTPTLSIQNPTHLPGWRESWNVEPTEWLRIGYETRTGTQVTSTGLEGQPGHGAARATNREEGSQERPMPCDPRWADCELLGLRDRARAR